MHQCLRLKTAWPGFCWTVRHQCLMSSLNLLRSLEPQSLSLNWWVCCSSTTLILVSIRIILWSLINVSVMMITCLVSWSLLVRKTSRILFLLVGSSIYWRKNWSRANCSKTFLPEPVFHVFRRLLFPFDNL